MKKIFLLVILLFSYLLAIDKNDVYNAYKNKDYNNACILGAKIYLKYKEDNDFLTVFADACLKVDNINRMAFPAMLLIKDKAARNNSVYFLTILYQKKLLYSALIDGMDISKYNFPTTDYILSKIFRKYVKKDYKKVGDIYIFHDNNTTKHYEMQLINENGKYKIMLKTFIDNKLIKTRTYW